MSDRLFLLPLLRLPPGFCLCRVAVNAFPPVIRTLPASMSAPAPANPNKVYVGNMNKATPDDALKTLFGAGNIQEIERSASKMYVFTASRQLWQPCYFRPRTSAVSRPVARSDMLHVLVMTAPLRCGVSLLLFPRILRQRGCCLVEHRFAWVTFKNAGAAKGALAKNGTHLEGFDLRVEEHKPREPRAVSDAPKVRCMRWLSRCSPSARLPSCVPHGPWPDVCGCGCGCGLISRRRPLVCCCRLATPAGCLSVTCPVSTRGTRCWRCSRLTAPWTQCA